MSTLAIPKEQQTAYQRWEMSSFGEADAHLSAVKAQKLQQAEQQAQSVSLILEGVRQEAYAKGRQEGFLVGMAQAREQAQAERAQFLQLMESFKQATVQTDEVIADDLLSLALDLAKAMLKTKLNVDPAAIIPVVANAIHYLPYVQKPARILVNHEDAHILREYLGEELASQDWQVLEDSSIERGGCLVETGANQIDSTNAVRWKRITDALSNHNDWMLP